MAETLTTETAVQPDVAELAEPIHGRVPEPEPAPLPNPDPVPRPEPLPQPPSTSAH